MENSSKTTKRIRNPTKLEFIFVLIIIGLALYVLYGPNKQSIYHVNRHQKSWNHCTLQRSEIIEMVNEIYQKESGKFSLLAGCLAFYEELSYVDRFFYFPTCFDYVNVCQYDIYNSATIDVEEVSSISNCFYDCASSLQALDILETTTHHKNKYK